MHTSTQSVIQYLRMEGADASDAMMYHCVGHATEEPGPDNDSVERRWMRSSLSA